MKTLEELQQQKAQIEKDCDHWKSSQDGSYGLSLRNSGYYEVLEQIKQIENTQSDRFI